MPNFLTRMRSKVEGPYLSDYTRNYQTIYGRIISAIAVRKECKILKFFSYVESEISRKYYEK